MSQKHLTHLADQELDHLEQLIDAIDTWTGWNTGRAVATSHLADSLDNPHQRRTSRPGVRAR